MPTESRICEVCGVDTYGLVTCWQGGHSVYAPRDANEVPYYGGARPPDAEVPAPARPALVPVEAAGAAITPADPAVLRARAGVRNDTPPIPATARVPAASSDI